VVAKRVGDDLVLEVHDDGPGVPKRYEILIWDRFERGAHRYNAAIPGSGIGLALVSMLVRAHDGTVGYRRSERLGGACFSVVLPGRARTVAQIPNLEPVGRRDP
jgi:K+-sensing histidine kinase KdpD